jgi:hypothetical protein
VRIGAVFHVIAVRALGRRQRRLDGDERSRFGLGTIPANSPLRLTISNALSSLSGGTPISARTFRAMRSWGNFARLYLSKNLRRIVGFSTASAFAATS